MESRPRPCWQANVLMGYNSSSFQRDRQWSLNCLVRVLSLEQAEAGQIRDVPVSLVLNFVCFCCCCCISCCCVFFCFWDRVSLCSLGHPGTMNLRELACLCLLITAIKGVPHHAKYQSIDVPINWSIHPFIHPPIIHLSTHRSIICLSIYLPVHLCVCV